MKRLFQAVFPLMTLGSLLLAPGLTLGAPPSEAPSGASSELPLAELPHLKQLLFTEPTPPVRFGMGLAPIMIMNNKAGFSANLFEVHWVTRTFNWTILSASYGTTFSGDPLSKINAFTFRSMPKLRLSSFLSVGPLVGVELISFPQVEARLYKGTLFTPPGESFSTRGYIYGATASETFRLSDRYQLQLSQLVYRQRYDPQGTNNGWKYYYADDALNRSKDLIAPGLVFLFEVSVLY